MPHKKAHDNAANLQVCYIVDHRLGMQSSQLCALPGLVPGQIGGGVKLHRPLWHSDKSCKGSIPLVQNLGNVRDAILKTLHSEQCVRKPFAGAENLVEQHPRRIEWQTAAARH